MIHELKQTWESPLTEKPKLEPLFAAGMQAIEISFLLLARFLDDSRIYVVKRPRIDLIEKDIREQMGLLAEIIDGELEDENVSCETIGSLTQNFPFEGAPPTQLNASCQSPALEKLLNSMRHCMADLCEPERQSLKKVVKNITGTFDTCFGAWTVGVGIEEQLSNLRIMVGLPPLKAEYGKHFLDYASLVKPHVVLLTDIEYAHKEDFFFRSVHLGTECWAFIANKRIESAMDQVNKYKNWDNAAAHVRSAAHIFDYLGNHVMLLTSMVLRDYLQLKVEIEGTSGEGSSAVKEFRLKMQGLFLPLVKILQNTSSMESEQESILRLYRHPEQYPSVYNFAKSLEIGESALLGGFYYKHFLLATNVIGTASRGTMQKMVPALKKTYETPLFPILDAVRTQLGQLVDKELEHKKGDIMKAIEIKRSSDCPFVSSSSACPFSSTNAEDASAFENLELENFEMKRQDLFSIRKLSKRLQNLVTSNLLVPFLDHAWGRTPPLALHNALSTQFELYSKGNSTWNTLFAEILPQASSHIKSILKCKSDSVIEFGHNSHELVTRLLSMKFPAIMDGQTLRILTTDTEFYSFTRQMNKLLELKFFKVDVVPIAPIETFESRLVSQVATNSYDVIYVSQCVFLTQQTIISNVGSFTKAINANCNGLQHMVIIDGYHGFGAIPTDLGDLETNVFYVSGVLKHVGGGANCAFVVCSPTVSLTPLFTGWLADPSVLSLESNGIHIGSPVGYMDGVSLMGATPSFIPSLLIFNEVMRNWNSRNIQVDDVHSHVMSLHELFLNGLEDKTEYLSKSNIVNLLHEDLRSHTLAFKVESPHAANFIVNSMLSRNIEIDSRQNFVRIGFGLNHGPDDVAKLLDSISKIQNI